jgi:transcriptional regulator with PAS, ATPase and Fis domain
MLNAALTHTWFQPFALGSQTLIAFFLSFISAGVFFMIPNKKGIITIGIVAGFSMVTIVVLQWQLGWILPLTGPLLAFGFSTLGAGLLVFHDQRIQTSTHLTNLHHTLHSLQQELRRKEEKALGLNQSLKEIRLAEQETAKRLKELESTKEEIETTRQELQKVEAELIRLRDQTTETSHEPSKRSPDQETLSAECRTLGILTYDPHLLRVFSDLKKSANSSNPILLLGETGTGKEVFAQAAHRLSGRAQRPFIPVNMAAIRPELFESELFGHVKGAFTGAIGGKGYVEAAEGGTLFLDEMGELSLDLQAKLLRLLDNHTFNRVGEARTRQANVRIVAATNRDLTQDVAHGRFREDLYYRLRSIVLYLPALRERIPEDRRLLAQHFLQQFADQDTHDTYRFSQDAMNTIISYPWPGNIREMKQTLAQAVSLAQTTLLTKEDLRLGENGSVRHTRKFSGPSTPGVHSKKVSARDDETVLASLREHRFDMQATAQALRCDRSTLTQRLKGLGYEALVRRKGDFSLAAKDLANDETLEPLVEQKIRDYEANLFPVRTQYHSAEEAIADCRRRFKNLPDRYFPAVEMLIRHRFASGS